MPKVDKQRQAAEVNSSYSIFFLLATIGICLVLTNSTIVAENDLTLLGSIGFALIIYFMWDLIRQLYSPGQSVLLYAVTFFVLPFIISASFYDGYFIFIAGWLTYILASLTAGIMEIIYEYIVKSKVPRYVMKRLVMTDSALDKSLLSFNDKHFSFFNLKGVIVYGLIVLVYYIALSIILSL